MRNSVPEEPWLNQMLNNVRVAQCKSILGIQETISQNDAKRLSFNLRI